MTSLYNCKHDGDQFRITKFDFDFNVEASYLCDLQSCECLAGHRPSCRHRQMLPKFIARNAVGTNWFWDHDRGGWVQGWQEPSQEPASQPLLDLPTQYPCTKEDCFGHVASKNDPKICGLCGTHIDSLRPDDEDSLALADPALTIETKAYMEPHTFSLAPTGLGQPSDLEPSSSSPHSPAATTTGFDPVDSGSIPLVATKTTIRRRL